MRMSEKPKRLSEPLTERIERDVDRVERHWPGLVVAASWPTQPCEVFTSPAKDGDSRLKCFFK